MILFIGIFSRIIPAQAMISAIPDAANRGSFMAVNSSLQQIAGGLGSVISGFIVTESITGSLEHFDIVGWIVSGTVIVTVLMLNSLRKKISEPL